MLFYDEIIIFPHRHRHLFYQGPSSLSLPSSSFEIDMIISSINFHNNRMIESRSCLYFQLDRNQKKSERKETKARRKCFPDEGLWLNERREDDKLF